MNYEVKSIQPWSVFRNAMQTILVVTFFLAVMSFYVYPSSVRITLWWQKILATGVFAVVYALAVGVLLFLAARIYNSCILEFDHQSLLRYNALTFSIAGFFMGVTKFFLQAASNRLLGPDAMSFWGNVGTTLLFMIVFTVVGTLGTTGFTIACHALFGPTKGISVTLGERPEE